MKIYPEEWECARRFQETQTVPRLTETQLAAVRATGKVYAKWYRAHPYIHNSISLAVVALLLGGDVLALLWLPSVVMGSDPSLWMWTCGLCVTSAIHGFIFYSIIIYTMHEGAAHERIIQRTGSITNALSFLVNNLNRLYHADPIYYRSRHTHHHADFGTPQDGAFTNFVHPRRFWISLLPLAGLLDFNDYRIHTGTQFSASKLASFLVGNVYMVMFGVFMVPAYGWTFTLLVLVVLSPWLSFTLDRLRETTEHNLMALDVANGARNLGCGFWGLLVGGGPWGQPCHLSHHLIPALPWYQQCLLHFQLRRLMTPAQRRYFNIEPIIGFPRLLGYAVATNHRKLKDLHSEKRSTQPVH